MSIDKETVERLLNNQESMGKDIADIKVILARQEENLAMHMYRTELAEKSLAVLQTEMKPIIQRHQTNATIISWVLKGAGIGSLGIGAVVGIIQILKFFFHL